MKVLFAVGIFLLITSGRARADEHDEYCCNLKKHASQVVETDPECITFQRLVAGNAQEIYGRMEKTHSEDLKKESVRQYVITQIKAKAVSDASRECIGSNPAFQSVHAAIDYLHSVLEQLPAPANVLKQISTAMDFMEQHFNELDSVIHYGALSPKISDRIKLFIEEHIGTAVGIFKKNNLAACLALIHSNDVPLEALLNTLAEKVGHALGFKMPSFQSMFESRQAVRYAAKDLSHSVAQLHHRRTEQAMPPEYSIDRMLSNFNVDMKELQALIEAEKWAKKYKSV